jgi:hypothetical protein
MGEPCPTNPAGKGTRGGGGGGASSPPGAGRAPRAHAPAAAAALPSRERRSSVDPIAPPDPPGGVCDRTRGPGYTPEAMPRPSRALGLRAGVLLLGLLALAAPLVGCGAYEVGVFVGAIVAETWYIAPYDPHDPFFDPCGCGYLDYYFAKPMPAEGPAPY